MANIFLISDTHFGQKSMLTFTRRYDETLRCRAFPSVEDMDEHIVQSWNSVVKPQDHVYHLGDVTMKKVGLETVRRLNGHKRLVHGNHDIFETKAYMAVGFEKIMGVRVIDDFVLTHIPVHPMNIKERWVANIHGHLHNNYGPNSFTLELGNRYFNVSCEVLGYAPISLEDVKARCKKWKDE